MAAIRKLKSGKYEVQVRRKGFAPVSKTFLMKNDAEQWARHMETKADIVGDVENEFSKQVREMGCTYIPEKGKYGKSIYRKS